MREVCSYTTWIGNQWLVKLNNFVVGSFDSNFFAILTIRGILDMPDRYLGISHTYLDFTLLYKETHMKINECFMLLWKKKQAEVSWIPMTKI